MIYEFEFDQSFQKVGGDARVDGKPARLPLFQVRGDQVSFEAELPQGAGLAKHRFQGRVRDDVIEGTVTIGGQKPLPWKAQLKARGELRMSALETDGSVPW